MRKAGAGAVDDELREFLGIRAGEAARMGPSHLVRFARHGGADTGVPMTQAGDDHATTGIEDGRMPFRMEENALATDQVQRGVRELLVDGRGHGVHHLAKTRARWGRSQAVGPS